MSASDFCGVPCTEPNAWEVVQSVPGLTLDVHGLQFCADFYNAHHACCWPRVLLDTHLGRATAEVKAASTDSAVAERLAFYADHIATVAEQLFAAQQAALPRASSARRVRFHDSVPPVLRCHAQSDAFGYSLRGQLRLRHCCVMPHSTPTPAEQQETQGIPSACTHAVTADALARDVFPLVLVMAPSDMCATRVDADPPSASAATAWRAKPLVLALESVTLESPTTAARHTGEEALGLTSGSELGAAVWCAAYTPFSWTCHPAGNQCRSPPLTKAATSQRASRSSASRGGTAAAPSPLRLSFAVYASRYTSASAQLRVRNAFESGDTYSLHVTKRVRFSLAAPEVYERAVLGAEREAFHQARSRRIRQLMHLFDHTPRVREESDTAGQSKRQRLEGVTDPSLRPPSGTRSQSHRAFPLVTNFLIGQLGTVHAIRCEWCQLPRATALASVLPLRSSSPVDTGDTEAPPCQWPLRVQCRLPDRGGAVVKLSPLDTLQRLADALRSVVDASNSLNGL